MTTRPRKQAKTGHSSKSPCAPGFSNGWRPYPGCTDEDDKEKLPNVKREHAEESAVATAVPNVVVAQPVGGQETIAGALPNAAPPQASESAAVPVNASVAAASEHAQEDVTMADAQVGDTRAVSSEQVAVTSPAEASSVSQAPAAAQDADDLEEELKHELEKNRIESEAERKLALKNLETKRMFDLRKKEKSARGQ
ncbi:hypothetical protein LTR85_003730 [Meristemomyces frigidus]|nr:hypothetical protein LTR85_003730 [Meristemomyces frigidus]